MAETIEDRGEQLTADADSVATQVAEAERSQLLHEEIIKVIKTCYDPEIPINIYELGLIYGVDIAPTGEVTVRMTLTSPACPAAGSLPGEVQSRVRGVEGVADARIDLVWDPPWNPNLMSEAARLQLGIF